MDLCYDDRPWLKPCPVCGNAMLANRKNTTSKKFDRFECLKCDLVIEYPKNDFKSKDVRTKS
jgi:ribosomal protein S27AE